MPAYIGDASKAGPSPAIELPDCPLYHNLSALQFKQGSRAQGTLVRQNRFWIRFSHLNSSTSFVQAITPT
jgi:hypothetical protein